VPLPDSFLNLFNLLNLRWGLLLLAVGLPACQPEQAQIQPLEPLLQEPHVQVYTNHEPTSEYTEPYRQLTRSGDNLEQIIIDAIGTATSTVDVAVQELRLPGIAAALVARQQAGVKVRVILENTYSRPFSAFTAAEMAQLPEREEGRYQESRQLIDRDRDGTLSPTEIQAGDALVMLDRSKVPRIDDTADGSAGSNLMHHKFLVVDGRTLIVTSANFTTSDMHGDFKSVHSRGNANNLLKIDSPELATLFTQEFKLMWGDGPGGKPDSRFGVKKPFRPARSVQVDTTQIEVQFSPTSPSLPWSQSSNGLIGKTLSQATKSIALALFVFSDQQLVDRLEPMHTQGTEIKALIDPGFAYRPYSEALDMLGILLPENCQLEQGNHVWQTPIATVGVPRLPPGDLLHHKFGIVDQQIVLTGSHNWTDAANTGNDETVLVVHSPIVAAHFQREFDRLYTDAVLGVPPAIQKRAAVQAQQCKSLQARNTGTATNPAETQTPRSQPAKSKSTQTHTQRVSQSQTGQRINLNTATLVELETLPGVGPGLAKRIIAIRQQQPFRSLADLDRVPGVGTKLLKKLETQVIW
jgi:competence ComEA-like helix-hairpin-helix protein